MKTARVVSNSTNRAEAAITREKQIKKWNQGWKIRLIEEMNPYWHDLYAELV